MSSVLAPISNGRRVLAPISPSKKRSALSSLGSSFANRQNQVLQNNKIQNNGSKLAPSPKRPLASLDENAIAFTKRVKSFASSKGAISAPKFFLVTDENATINAKGKSLNGKMAAPRPEKVSGRSALTTIKGGSAATSTTSTQAAPSVPSYSFAAKGSDGGVVVRRKKASGHSPIKDGARGVKRTHTRFIEELKVRKASTRRVDPPSKSGNNNNGGDDAPISIDEILSGKSKDASAGAGDAKGRSIAYPVSPQSRRSATTTANSNKGPLFPESWMFQIHEDTEEETLTNMVDFHTGNLDISDDEDKTRVLSELELKGKENIPPPDDESYYSTPVVVDADTLAMPPPPQPSTVAEKATTPIDHKAASKNKPRSPLSTIPTAELYPSSSETAEKSSKSRPMSRLSESASVEDLETETSEAEQKKEDIIMAEQ